MNKITRSEMEWLIKSWPLGNIKISLVQNLRSASSLGIGDVKCYESCKMLAVIWIFTQVKLQKALHIYFIQAWAKQIFMFSEVHLLVRQWEMTGGKKWWTGVWCASGPFCESVYLFILASWEGNNCQRTSRVYQQE